MSMQTTTIHVKTEVKTRDEAAQVAKELGFTLTSLVNAMLKQVARTRKLNLSLDETPNQQTIADLERGEEDVKAGRFISFASGKDALAYLDKKIQAEKERLSKHGK
jgi:addiction module RelB/DinJ family antitoxin